MFVLTETVFIGGSTFNAKWHFWRQKGLTADQIKASLLVRQEKKESANEFYEGEKNEKKSIHFSGKLHGIARNAFAFDSDHWLPIQTFRADAIGRQTVWSKIVSSKIVC